MPLRWHTPAARVRKRAQSPRPTCGSPFWSAASRYATNSSRARLAPLRDTPRAMPEESTTPDLVELARRSIEAANRRDFDGVLAVFAADGVWDLSPLGMGIFEGHAAIRRFFVEWIGAYEGYEVAPEELHDFGNGVTLSVARQRGRLPGAEGWVELRYATVGIWLDGLTMRGTNYTDLDQARADAERLAQERK
jgi:ketosteroid isomerase-like protein